MPDQHDSNVVSRLGVVLMRCGLSVLYLWIMMHASAIFMIPLEYTETGFWVQRHNVSVVYRSLFIICAKSEIYIYLLVALVLNCLYRTCRCSIFGGRLLELDETEVRVDFWVYIYIMPYMAAFLACWFVSTCITFAGLMSVPPLEESVTIIRMYGQFIGALLFKLMILVNFHSTCLRGWTALKIFEIESERLEEVYNYHNFGEYLNMFFRV
ncbi:hypothetical protein KR009_011116 [Drosophila setifemur]|nr:hypothetical protein KR009_011116 [Drosophila setifemur]